MKILTVRTGTRIEMIDITPQLRILLKESKIRTGTCHVFIPHTTAAVTINENADPDVVRDIIATMDRVVPLKGDYRHMEGNSAAHIKASMFGVSQTIFVENGDFVLGTWQSIFFCEFDGPRTRKAFVKFVGPH